MPRCLYRLPIVAGLASTLSCSSASFDAHTQHTETVGATSEAIQGSRPNLLLYQVSPPTWTGMQFAETAAGMHINPNFAQVGVPMVVADTVPSTSSPKFAYACSPNDDNYWQHFIYPLIPGFGDVSIADTIDEAQAGIAGPVIMGEHAVPGTTNATFIDSITFTSNPCPSGNNPPNPTVSQCHINFGNVDHPYAFVDTRVFFQYPRFWFTYHDTTNDQIMIAPAPLGTQGCIVNSFFADPFSKNQQVADPTASFTSDGKIAVTYWSAIKGSNGAILVDIFNPSTGVWEKSYLVSGSAPMPSLNFGCGFKKALPTVPGLGNGCLRWLSGEPQIAVDPLGGTILVSFAASNSNPTSPKVESFIFRKAVTDSAFRLVFETTGFNTVKPKVAAAFTYDLLAGASGHFWVHATGEVSGAPTNTAEFAWPSYDDGQTWGNNGVGTQLTIPQTWTNTLFGNGGYWGDFNGLIFDYAFTNFFYTYTVPNSPPAPQPLWTIYGGGVGP